MPNTGDSFINVDPPFPRDISICTFGADPPRGLPALRDVLASSAVSAEIARGVIDDDSESGSAGSGGELRVVLGVK